MGRDKTIADSDKGFLFFPTGSVIKDKHISRRYYANMLVNRIHQIFKWSELPDTIPQRFLENYLIRTGNACVTLVEAGRCQDGSTHESALYAFSGAFGGYQDEYYFPRSYIVNNPFFNFNKEMEIGKDCVIIANDTYYYGLQTLISRYAEILTELDISALNLSIMSRSPFGLVARDDREMKSAELFLKRLQDGENAILAENLVFEGIKNLDLSARGNVITQLIELRQYYVGSFFNEIGINANFNMKREAINASETDLNRDALFPLIDDMLNQRKIACEAINALYGTHISVDLSSAWKDEREEQDAILDSLKEGGSDAGTDSDTGESTQIESQERVSSD